MRLPRPFFRLPLRFDAERLRVEVAALPQTAWVRHPNEIAGNSAARLITVDGGENDAVNGPMAPTAHLAALPYVRQVLASFGVAWSRSRLLRLAPGACVPEHADINHHWFYRVRLHIPVVTSPTVRFHCDGTSVHMAAGEAWVFDNWRLHHVENPGSSERIHLVADTTGGSRFWQLVGLSEQQAPDARHTYQAGRDDWPTTERTVPRPVMPPPEVDLLVLDLRAELVAADARVDPSRLARYHGMLDGFCRDWRQAYLIHGEDAAGRAALRRFVDQKRDELQAAADGLVMRTNRVAAHVIFEGRVLRAILSEPRPHGTLPAAPLTTVSGPGANPSAARLPPAASVVRPQALQRPVFIVAAPRSGSTLLFETLAAGDQTCTVGGEGHMLVEGLESLRPGAPTVDSNRLGARHATDAVRDYVTAAILEQLCDAAGRRVAPTAARRFLEKTPKNALRIPFFDRLFPDAQFVFLWREPRANIASIIEAWKSGRWKTYNGLPGFAGPWSLLLPPGWRALNGRPIEEIAAFQWEAANRAILDDLSQLPPERWHALRYEDLMARPADAIRGVCGALGVAMDAALEARVQAPLPLSRFTLTPPAAAKWERHADALAAVLPGVQLTWRRLEELAAAHAPKV